MPPNRPPQRRGPPPRMRRGLTMPAMDGRTRAEGEPPAAEALVNALRLAQADREDAAASLTHPFHSYPAKLHPATARALVDLVIERAPLQGPLVDPFCGSGTVLVEGRAARSPVIGNDLNPLAALVARAKSWSVPVHRRQKMRDLGHQIAGQVMAAGKAARRSGAEAPPKRKPRGFDPNARDRRLAAWFAPHVRRELEMIAMALDDLREADAELADILTACLSAILYKVSSRTSDTDKTWVDRNIPRGAPARHFGQRVDLLYAGLTDLRSTSTAQVFEGDARQLTAVIKPGSAAGIVTSPPYAGTYNYAEHQRLRFDFLGLHHRDLDKGEIGSRRSYESGVAPANQAWRQALVAVLDSFAEVLAPGAHAAIVIGDSVAQGRAIYALDDVRSALSDELSVVAVASQERFMHGTIERRAFGDRVKAEHAILLRRR